MIMILWGGFVTNEKTVLSFHFEFCHEHIIKNTRVIIRNSCSISLCGLVVVIVFIMISTMDIIMMTIIIKTS